MSFFALFGLDGGQVLLILALMLILLGATKLPGRFSGGLRQGIKEFRKAERNVNEEIAEQPHGERSNDWPSHPVLIALTFILGTACVILVVYEFSE